MSATAIDRELRELMSKPRVYCGHSEINGLHRFGLDVFAPGTVPPEQFVSECSTDWRVALIDLLEKTLHALKDERKAA